VEGKEEVKVKSILLIIVMSSLIISSFAVTGCVSTTPRPFPPPPSGQQYQVSIAPTPTPTPTPTLTSVPIKSPIPLPDSTPPTIPTPTPEQTPIKLLQLSGPVPLERPIWDRGIGSISIGNETVSQNTFLFIMGSATNIGTETLNSVICIMKCWNGDNLVKIEEQVIGTVFEEANITIYDTISPGDSFEFDIQTPDDPTVDNVTVEFKDSSGNIIPQIIN
jgi:hypothetical protein